ncbi:hypothetical protein CR513_06770, partial [Mucuna pruriens]
MWAPYNLLIRVLVILRARINTLIHEMFKMIHEMFKMKRMNLLICKCFTYIVNHLIGLESGGLRTIDLATLFGNSNSMKFN